MASDDPDLRRAMVDCQLRTFDVTDQAVLSAFEAVPRTPFVAQGYADVAYSDRALPSASQGRTLLPPMILARLVQGARIAPGDRALVVGDPYAAAIVGRLAGSVVTLAADSDLVEEGRRRLDSVGADNAEIVAQGEPHFGHAAGGPYDVIVVDGAVEVEPAELLAQLADGGRLVAVESTPRASRAVCFSRDRDDIGRRALFDARVPVLDAFRRAPAFVF